MKYIAIRIFISILLVILVTGCTRKQNPSISIQLSDELRITEIEESVFLVTHSFPWPGNSLIVLMDKQQVLWIDTPYTPEATALVLDWIKEKFGDQCSVTEINTGFHIDNLGGNEVLVQRNIPVYGSDRTCELLETRSQKTMSIMTGWLTGEKNHRYHDVYSDFNFQAPTEVFGILEEQVISFGSGKAVVHFPGPSHTDDNLVVFIPEKKLLFGGCMVFAADATKPGFVEDGDLDEWVKALANVEKRFSDIRIIIPGHGEPGDARLLEHTREIVSAAGRH